MSNQPFTFPPPPPPPPKRTTESAQPQNYGSHNNRGSFRGGYSWRGDARGGRGGRGGFSHPRPGHQPPGSPYRSNPPSKTFHNAPQRGGYLNPPQKRNHTTAFNSTSQSRPPRPTAAPAVPSFNASIEHLLPRKPSIDQSSQDAQKPKKQNLLGLTPAKLEQDSEPEDDEDEETRLGPQTRTGLEGLMFEYKGHTSTLKTAAEIAAWIAERKKRYPTLARSEVAKKEAEEKKRQWEEEKKAKREAQLQHQKERAEQRKAEQQKRKADAQSQQASNADPASALDATARAKLKAEKLRQKALKAQEDLAKAEEALRRAQAEIQASTTSNAPLQSTEEGEFLDPQPDADGHADEDEELDDPDMTSSSGSSTSESDGDDDDLESISDSDSAPETLSTKQAARGIEGLAGPAVPRPSTTTTTTTTSSRAGPHAVCKVYAKNRRCRFGSSCRFSHDLSLIKNGIGLDDEDHDEDGNDNAQRNKRAANTTGDRRGQRRGRGATTTASGAGNLRRKGLWQVMVEQEREAERRSLLSAIVVLGENGVLEEPKAKKGSQPQSQPQPESQLQSQAEVLVKGSDNP